MLLPIAHPLGLSMYKPLIDSDKYLLSYGIFINPLEPDVQQMTPQILSILIDFTKTHVSFFRSIFKSLDLYNYGSKDINTEIKIFVPVAL